MTAPVIPGRLRFPVTVWPWLFAAIAAPMGCDPAGPRGLVVATSWPRAERARLTAEFPKWLASSRLDSVSRPIHLKWLPLAPGDDLDRVTRRRDAPDVLLGVPISSLEQLGRDGRLVLVDGEDPVAWYITPGMADQSPAMGDPRTDAVWRGWAMKQLEPARWREGYARLVTLAGHEPRIGGLAGKPWPAPGGLERSASPGFPLEEGVGIFQTGRDPVMARAFLRFLVETRQAAVPPRRAADVGAPGREVESLVADLLGATLVDAQDELWKAWSALEAAGSPEPARTWLTEPPPWPPLSVAKYLRPEGEQAMSLIETLAGEMSPLPAARAWLIRSWLSPARTVDAALLNEMTRAADGALCREPRFRAWLRAEWTATARQRYRRVARLAARPQAAVMQ
jgi:hypothetical protein